MKLLAKVTGCKLVPVNQVEWFAGLGKLEGKTVEVKALKDRRSNAQNRNLWVLYGVISKRTFELYKNNYLTPDDVHELTLSELSYIIKGNGFKIVKRSSQMNTAEFTKYIEALKVWARDTFDIYSLPEPSDLYE